VQSYVFHLRQVLGPDRSRGSAPTVLVTVPEGYRLVADRRSVDATRFEELLAAGDAALGQGNPERAVTLYGQALSLWRGDVLADLSDHEFVAPVRARLEEERASALESRVQAELDLGHHQAVVNEIGTLIADHPLRERLHALRILALYRSGRQSDALAAYRELRRVLDTELGIEPSPPLQELNNQVLRQDPALDWHPPARLRNAGPIADLSPEPVPPPVAAHGGSPRRRLAAIGAAVAVLAGGAALPVAGAPPASAEVLANAVSELDASGKVLASVPLKTNPIALASSPGAIWVVTPSENSVTRINTATHAVEQTIPVGDDPRALAVTDDDLWVTNFGDRTVTHINIEANDAVQTIDVGTRPDAIAAGPAGLWVANSGDNTIQRIDTTTGVPEKPIYVEDGPDGLAVGETSVWVANGRSGLVLQIDAETGATTSSIRVGSGPRGIVRAGDDLWVADELSQTVTRIDVATERPHQIDLGGGPTAVAVLGADVWVAEKYAGDVARIDRESSDVDRIDIGAPVNSLAVADGHLWVASGAFASTSHLGGELRITMAEPRGYANFKNIDPARSYDIWTSQATRIVYDGLLALNYSSADPQVLVPDLAMNVPEPTDGGRTYIFNLRPGVRYSTGTDVRASDVVLGVHRALHPHGARPDLYWSIVGAKACTKHWPSCDLSDGVVADDAAGRVTFHLVAPDPEFRYKLTMLVVPTPAGTPAGRLEAPVPGTGPYQIVPGGSDAVLTLTRNPSFQQWSVPAQPAGFPDTITWRFATNASQAADAVEHGQADLADVTVPGEAEPQSQTSLVAGLAITAPTRLHSSVLEGTAFVALNSSRPPFDDRMARRALNFAIDRGKVIDMQGGPSLAHLTCQIMPPGMPSYQQYCPYTDGPPSGDYSGPDLARARALVDASGTRGMEVTVGDIVGDGNRLPRYLAEVLRSLGYRVTIRRLPKEDHSHDILQDPHNDLDVGGGTVFGADYPVPSTFYGIVACATSNGEVAVPLNYCNPALDRLAAKAAAMLQSEPGRALRIWTRIDRTLTDEAPFIATANFVRCWLTSERVGNYLKGDLTPGPLLSQLWVR
jgi:YVTN family beta-propeller protein